ncbi:2-oxo-4-hydroxy-4-carboxy-5-ureidoimidazoline decarboxylase [Streptomyces sp. NPDC008150]|uniref:2-oxo-4-hydroxy-4-carboxy-5-ureidoimidazoline decarboxylase n=1 Tax=Streptomyces sp. NPDC008150 TaxID=3364816 RepID=UPI0036E70B2E
MHRHPHFPGRALPPERPSRPALPVQARGNPLAPHLERFNSAPGDVVRAALAGCLRSPRWAHRVAAHRPYPDLEALLAAADEAAYDLAPGEIAEALAGEPLPSLPDGAYVAAHTALRAAHTAYRSRFGHVFVICVDGVAPDEVPDLLLTGIRDRLGNDPEDERVLVAEELRRLARGRLIRLVRACGPYPEAASAQQPYAAGPCAEAAPAQGPPRPDPSAPHTERRHPESRHPDGRYPERVMSGRTSPAGPAGTSPSAAGRRPAATAGARPAGGLPGEAGGPVESGKTPESAESAESIESADCREATGSGAARTCSDSPYVPV